MIMIADYVEEIIATLEELGFEISNFKRDYGLLFLTLNKNTDANTNRDIVKYFFDKADFSMHTVILLENGYIKMVFILDEYLLKKDLEILKSLKI